MSEIDDYSHAPGHGKSLPPVFGILRAKLLQIPSVMRKRRKKNWKDTKLWGALVYKEITRGQRVYQITRQSS